MYKKLKAEEYEYLITIYYLGKKLNYRIQQHHTDREKSSWFFYSKHQVQELEWYYQSKVLKQVIQPGQTPFPEEFMAVLQNEFEQLVKP